VYNPGNNTKNNPGNNTKNNPDYNTKNNPGNNASMGDSFRSFTDVQVLNPDKDDNL
jgi:hypothetical protein